MMTMHKGYFCESNVWHICYIIQDCVRAGPDSIWSSVAERFHAGSKGDTMTSPNAETTKHIQSPSVVVSAKWKHFQRHWPFVRGIHRLPVNSPHKGQWRRELMFSLICAWINAWVNNREAGDLKCYRAHYDVIVMDFRWKSTCRSAHENKKNTHLCPNYDENSSLLISTGPELDIIYS